MPATWQFGRHSAAIGVEVQAGKSGDSIPAVRAPPTLDVGPDTDNPLGVIWPSALTSSPTQPSGSHETLAASCQWYGESWQ